MGEIEIEMDSRCRVCDSEGQGMEEGDGVKRRYWIG